MNLLDNPVMVSNGGNTEVVSCAVEGQKDRKTYSNCNNMKYQHPSTELLKECRKSEKMRQEKVAEIEECRQNTREKTFLNPFHPRERKRSAVIFLRRSSNVLHRYKNVRGFMSSIQFACVATV